MFDGGFAFSELGSFSRFSYFKKERLATEVRAARANGGKSLNG
jgi:hypothetical protein